MHQLPDIQHRAVHILMNMVAADKEIAQAIVESTMMEILMALSMLEEPDRQGARQCAQKALESAVEWELIKPNKERTPEMQKKQMAQLQALQLMLQAKRDEEEKRLEEVKEGEEGEEGEKKEEEEKKEEGEEAETKEEEKESVTEEEKNNDKSTKEGEKTEEKVGD